MNVGCRHDRSEHGEVVVHLAAAIALDGNVSHPLALGFLLVLAPLKTPPLFLTVAAAYNRRHGCILCVESSASGE